MINLWDTEAGSKEEEVCGVTGRRSRDTRDRKGASPKPPAWERTEAFRCCSVRVSLPVPPRKLWAM